MKSLEVRIKYHDDKYPDPNPEFHGGPKPLTRLNKIQVGDWIDLYAAEDWIAHKGDFKLISLGISVQLPAGYEAHIATRSSTFKTWGILMANSHGIIDESYCGDNDIWKFPALAMRDTVINRGDKICQFRLVEKMPKVEFVEVQELGNPDRGGIGSTGTK